MADITTLLKKDEFEKFFNLALSDAAFAKELAKDDFAALERRGFSTSKLSPAIRENMKKMAGQARTATYKCGLCGVCGVCALCGEINFGSASAALWAIFTLA